MNGISSSKKAERGFPASAASRSAISSARSSIASAIFSSRFERSPGVAVDHPSKAPLAALTAASTSRLPDSGALAIVSPVAGSITASRSPSTGGTNLPPIMLLSVRALGFEFRLFLELRVAVAVAISPPWSGFLCLGEHLFDRRVLDADSFGDGRMGDLTGGDVDAEAKARVAASRAGDAVVGEGEHIRQGGVGQSIGRRDRHRAGH